MSPMRPRFNKRYDRHFKGAWRAVFPAMQVYVSEVLSALPPGARVRIELAKNSAWLSPEDVRDDVRPWVDRLKQGPQTVQVEWSEQGVGHVIEIELR
ncbi:MAG: hypothetical protein ACREDG_09505 [Methylocella sp.]